MFSVLLFVITFFIPVIVSYTVVKVFDAPVSAIFQRIIQDKISRAWDKYIKFAAYITGISGGVNIYKLEDYIAGKIKLNLYRCILEIYRLIIETLQSLALMYLSVFLLALIAFAIVRGFELKHTIPAQEKQE